MKAWRREWILASASPRRQFLLARLGRAFRVEVSAVPEIAEAHLTPRENCLANAAAKARAVARRFPGALVIGADTEVALGQRVFGKPRDRAEAIEFLQRLSGRTHEVVTGVALVCAAARFRVSFAEITRVTFHELDRAHLEAYVDAVPTLDKAGAYAVQERGEALIEEIEGSLTNVVGLPLAALRRALDAVPASVRMGRTARPRGA